MKKIISILIYILLIGSEAFSQEITLWQCLDSAKANLNLQRSLENSNSITNLQIANTKTGYMPVIKLEGQASYQSEAIEIDLPIPGIEIPKVPLDQYKAYLEINQMIYDGGMIKNNIDILKLSEQENQEKNKIQTNTVENNVAQIYFLVLLLDKQEKIIENQLHTLKTQLKSVEAAVNNQIMDPVNKDIITSELLKVQQKLVEVQNSKKAGLKALAYYTNQKYEDTTHLSFPNIELLNDDTISNPQLRLLEINQQKLSLLDNQINAMRRPKVFAFAQAGYGRPGLNLLNDEFSPYYIIGLKFSWQLTDWVNARRSKQINAIKQNQISIEKQNITIKQDIQKQNILARIATLNQTIEKDKQILALQQKILKTYDSQLKNGIITISEYIIQVNKLSQIQLTLELHKIQREQLKFQYNHIY